MPSTSNKEGNNTMTNTASSTINATRSNIVTNTASSTQNTTRSNTMTNTAALDLDTNVKNLINNTDLTADDRNFIRRKWQELRNQKLNILITGATGCGKSSTINALFNMDSANTVEVATVGTGPDPETMDIAKYEIGNMVLWDSPGLGDGKEADERHARNIVAKLNERDAKGDLLVDLVLVVLDGSTRDLGTSYELINKVIIPNLGKNKKNRILVAINQADAAMNGRHWDYGRNCPDAKLVEFLDEKCESVRRRIYDGTGVDIEPIYYSAGYKEEGSAQERPYNLAKLLYFILKHIPAEKRLVAIKNANKDTRVWADNDDKENYREKSRELTAKGVMSWMGAGAALGSAVGSIIPGVGTAVGAAVGTVLGGVFGLAKSFFGW